MKRWLMAFLILLALCMSLCAAADEMVTVAVEGDVKGFADNPITVTSTEEGRLTLTISDSYNVYRTITVERVSAGTTIVPWDGLGENQERLASGSYTLTAEIETVSGKSLSTAAEITAGRCGQAVLFALPSSDTLYLEGNEKWFAEVKLIRAGTVVIEYCRADDPGTPLYTQQKQMGTGVNNLRWDGKLARQAQEPGEYLLRIYPKDNPSWGKEVCVTLAAGAEPVLPLTVTETYLPAEDASDEEIWRVMMQPSAVLDIKSTSHQKVYDQPSKQGKVLGTLHGSSQGVKVLEIRDDGWALIGAWNHEDGSYVEGYVQKERLTMVQPSEEYGLLLNKKAQTLTLFYHGARMATLHISTGLVAKNKLIRETPAGAFLTLEHMDDFASEGYKYAYVIRYDGGNLLHQLGYKDRGGRRDFYDQSIQLGKKASHGCVRLPFTPGEGNINAYWMWTHLPYHTRVMILDDPEERTLEAAAANAGKSAARAVLTKPASPTDLAADETELILTLGGDAVLGTREAWWKLPESLPSYLDQYGMSYPFSGLYEVFAEDDMTLINLECVLKADSSGEDKDKLYRFRGLPGYTEALTGSSIEQVNIANNHYIDYGKAGQESTRAALEEAGMPYSGYGYAYVWDCKGHRVGFAGCRETTYRQNRSVISRDIEALQNAGCEVIIYSCHWGTEYSATHNDLQEEMAKEAVRAGADLIVGTHPHVVQGVAVIDHTPVLYSLGNLMFGGTHDMTTFDAALARVHLRFGEEGYEGLSLRMIPVLTSGSAAEGKNDFRPVVAEGLDMSRILAKIQTDSDMQLTDAMWFPASGQPGEVVD